MPILLECPRCRQPLAVPKKMAGGYALCPKCKGRLWVPEDAPSVAAVPGAGPAAAVAGGTSPADAVGEDVRPADPVRPPVAAAALPVGPPPPGLPPSPARVPPPVAPPVVPPASKMRIKPPAAASDAGPGEVAVGPPPQPAEPQQSPLAVLGMSLGQKPKKVARLITAEMVQSPIKPLPDGKLPVLQLDEGRSRGQEKVKTRSVHPAVLAGILSLSVVLSIAIVFLGDNDNVTVHSAAKAAARRVIEEQYFSVKDTQRPLEPYQIYLRQAQQAYGRGDFRQERELYRRVLALLRQERETYHRGLTGLPARDAELEKQIGILLRTTENR